MKPENKEPKWLGNMSLQEARKAHDENVVNNVTLGCMVCDKEFQGKEPQMCCSGVECGCMGMPTEPIVCSQECYDKLMNRN